MALGFFVRLVASTLAGSIEEGIERRKEEQQLAEEAETWPPEEVKDSDGRLLGYVRCRQYLGIEWERLRSTLGGPWGAWPYLSIGRKVIPKWNDGFNSREDAVQTLVHLAHFGMRLPPAPWGRERPQVLTTTKPRSIPSQDISTLLEQQRYSDAIREIERRGITIQLRGDNLHLSPPEAMTPTLVASLRTHKRELLVVLRKIRGSNRAL